MQLPEFDRSLPMMLLRAREATMQEFRPILTAAGLTEQQWRVVRTLADVERASVSDVAARCSLQLPSMTRIVRHLSDAGLVVRSTDPLDQRRTHLEITDEGRAVIRRLAPRIRAVYDDLDRRLGDLGIPSLVGQLDVLVEGLDADQAESA